MTPPFYLVGEESPWLQPRLGGPNVTLEGVRRIFQNFKNKRLRVFQKPNMIVLWKTLRQ
jgi:hypothetical protein